jgi:lysozyme
MADVIFNSVGQNGTNRREDVVTVQRLLVSKGYGNILRGYNMKTKADDGYCGPRTVQAIKEFQKKLGFQKPDGLIAPQGRTWQGLINNGMPSAVVMDTSATSAVPTPVVSSTKVSTGGDTKKINRDGLKIIKESEGLYLEAYPCPAGIWTIGYGHTSGVKKGMTITEAEADTYLRSDVISAEQDVSNKVKVSLNSNQFSALVSFVFNIGGTQFSASTLLKKLNVSDYAGAAAEFGRWNKANGKVLSGLVTRRDKEKNFFSNEGNK